MGRKAVFAVILVLAAVGGAVYFEFGRHQPEPVLARDGPVVAFRIDMEAPAGSEVLHAGWPTTKRLALEDPVRREVLAALHDPANFRGGSVRCFSPGMAFRVGTGASAVDALVCLDCDN